MNEEIITLLDEIIEDRKLSSSEKSYVKSLLEQGDKKLIEKVREEAEELISVLQEEEENDLKEKLIHEAADLWFHVLVLLASRDLKGEDIIKELKKRLGTSGLIEKASRD
jgi:phosphoribosyl-ATP pyrophosphohydrolase